MNNECRLVDGTGLTVAVGSRDQVMSFLKTQSLDGDYVVVGPGIDARFYRIEAVVYPSGGMIDGQTIPKRSRDECLAVFGMAMELNKGTNDILSDEQFMRELEALDGWDAAASAGTDLPDPENEEEPTDDGDEQRYTLHEWVQKETDSYGDCLQQMSGTELIEAYRRQGGEEAAYFDPVAEEIVIEGEKESS